MPRRFIHPPERLAFLLVVIAGAVGITFLAVGLDRTNARLDREQQANQHLIDCIIRWTVEVRKQFDGIDHHTKPPPLRFVCAHK